jgi:hypothetical protein
MRQVYLDLITNSRATDDDYYYLTFDEDTTELYVEHSWHYWKSSSPDQGTEKLSLEEVKKNLPDIYRKAVRVITAVFPSEEDQRQLKYPLSDAD